MLGLNVREQLQFSVLPTERIKSPEAELRQWARDTWGSVKKMIHPNTGLPVDLLYDNPDIRDTPSHSTTPTNMAALIWSTVSASDLGIIKRPEALTIVSNLLDTYTSEKFEKYNNLPFNWYDCETGKKTVVWQDKKGDESPHTPFISAIDTGWWMQSLILASRAFPELSQTAKSIVDRIDLSTIYDPNLNLFHGKVAIEQGVNPSSWYVDVFNTEGRMAVYMAVMLGKIPNEALFKLGVEIPTVGNGLSENRNHQHIIKSYNGSLLENLTPAVLINEGNFLMNYSGGKLKPPNHQENVAENIFYGNNMHGGRFAFSPCLDPDGEYREHGNPTLAMGKGYSSSDVEAVHAYFLTYPFAPAESQAAIKRIMQFPGAYQEELGFTSSVNTNCQNCQIAPGRLIEEQGFIMASIDNLVNNNKMQSYLEVV